jgi:hypothetical protein
MDFPMVTGFIIDPMHTGIEGAFSRWFEGFILVPKEGKLSSAKIEEAYRRIKFFHLCRPFGFDRYVGKLVKITKYTWNAISCTTYYIPFFKEIFIKPILNISCFYSTACCCWEHLTKKQSL